MRHLAWFFTMWGHYTSMACYHENHADCPQQCKTCRKKCRCACHVDEKP